ncbi:hypothetical protein [Ectopseudomonas khazarica]|uniref:hypothetical protein n=1 Tax=Ectopseudomonas khazarica TaxID=2502979 RepID=UPI003B956692
MALRGFALVPLCLSLSSCALFNPYVQNTQSVVDAVPRTGTNQAQRMKAEFKSKTNQLAYWQSGTAAAFAGALGLGGYRAVTGNHAHQVAALTAGSAALYGFSAAQYKPTKEQIYHRGVEAVVCLESIYEPSSVNTGLSLINKIHSIKVKKGTTITIDNEGSLLLAIRTAEQYDSNYRQSLSEVAASMNKYLASLQPPPEITYRIISDAIKQTAPTDKPKKATTTLTLDTP